MLVLIVLLSCLVSILIITLLNVEKLNSQLIVFLLFLLAYYCLRLYVIN